MIKTVIASIFIFLSIAISEAKVVNNDTQDLIKANHEKVEVNKWMTKHLPFIADISKFNNYSTEKFQSSSNPFKNYIALHSQNSFKANWKISNKTDNFSTKETPNNNKGNYRVETYKIKNYISYSSIPRSNRKIDLVLVKKSQHRMELVKNNKVFKIFHIALGKNPIGNKEKINDNKTPEGKYTLDYKKDHSQYHLAVHISYPNAEDIERAKQNKVNPGGMIFIHGQPNTIGSQDDENADGEINFNKFIQPSNWTNGCIALLNSDMHEFYNMVDIGTPIEIVP